MTTPDTSGPAFPTDFPTTGFAAGMTRREHFAALCMAAEYGIDRNRDAISEGSELTDIREIAEEAVRAADALLRALKL